MDWKIKKSFITEEGNLTIKVEIGKANEYEYTIKPDEKGNFKGWEEELKERVGKNIKEIKTKQKGISILEELKKEIIPFELNNWFIIKEYEESAEFPENCEIKVKFLNLPGAINKKIVLPWKDITEKNIISQFKKEISKYQEMLIKLKTMEGKTFHSD